MLNTTRQTQSWGKTSYKAQTESELEFLARLLAVIQDQLDHKRQKDLASELDLCSSMISTWKHQGYLPNTKYLLKIVQKYNVNPVWLFTGRGEMYGHAVHTAPQKDPVLEELHELEDEVNKLRNKVNRLTMSYRV